MGLREFLFGVAHRGALHAATGKSMGERRRDRWEEDRQWKERERERRTRFAVPFAVVVAIGALVAAGVVEGPRGVLLAFPFAGSLLGIALLTFVLGRLAPATNEDAGVLRRSAQTKTPTAPTSPPTTTSSARSEELDDALEALKRKMRR